MRYPARPAPWLRRTLALAGAAGLILGSSLVPAAALARPVSGTASAPAPRPAVKASTATTVPGPAMYNPKTHSPFPFTSSVTVSQTTSLVNQVVQVSWKGFTPSNNQGTGIHNYSPSITLYPVMVAQCPGLNPTSLTQCYGALNGGAYGNFGKYGPYTAVYATTQGGTGPTSGTGTIPIQVQTAIENQGLGCDQNHACSLVILPIQGGEYINPPHGQVNCTNHSQDSVTATAQADLGQYQGACAWLSRIIVPLHFAPTPSGCPFRNPGFSIQGSPMMQRAMTSWETGLCRGAGAMSMLYNSEVQEPAAQGAFLGGGTDIAFTTRPASGPGKYPYTYAPIAVTASTLAYWLDNSNTGQPYTNLKFNARLLAKLLTTSYNFDDDNCQGLQTPPPIGCDNSIDHNPRTLFADPEFKQLNPHLATANLNSFQVPTVQSGNSDMTYTVTRWIAADSAAAGFLAGQFDPWGMHVNTWYLGLKYPTDTFLSQDPYTVIAHKYSPVYPPQLVPMYQADNWDPGTQYTPVIGGGPPTYPKDTPEAPGNRALFAILGEPDAAAFALPAMAMLNHAGAYVTPTLASMAAAIRDSYVNPDGITRSIRENSTDKAQYPLTMPVYAMVPTGGISHAKAVKIAAFLDFVAGRGQTTGTSPGQLPAGYLPLPASMRAQTLKAAYEVLHQTGAHSSGHGNGAGSGSGSGSGTGTGSHSSTSGKGSSGNSSGTPGHGGKANAAFSSPDSNGFARLLLPILLGVGLLLALAGPSAVVLGRPGGRAAVIAGWRRVTGLRHLPARLRGRNQ